MTNLTLQVTIGTRQVADVTFTDAQVADLRATLDAVVHARQFGAVVEKANIQAFGYRVAP